MQDVVIIGSGPAGLSAALYILRGGFSTTVIGKDNGALEKAEKIENYFGLDHPLSGHELIENGRKQVQDLGGTLLQDEVVGISWNGNYLVSTASTQSPRHHSHHRNFPKNIENQEPRQTRGAWCQLLCRLRCFSLPRRICRRPWKWRIRPP